MSSKLVSSVCSNPTGPSLSVCPCVGLLGELLMAALKCESSMESVYIRAAWLSQGIDRVW